MGCWHGHGHGCGWLPPPDWYEPYEWGPPWLEEEAYLAAERARARRRMRRGSRGDEPLSAASLEARAAELRQELSRIEEDIRRLSSRSQEATET
jgi:hypothetical protein